MNGRFLLVAVLSLPAIGCGPSHEETILERSELLIGHLVDQNYAACVELTDPDFVRQKGTDGTQMAFRLMGVFVKLGNITHDRVRIERVTVAKDANTATADVSVLAGDTWRPLQPLKWRRVAGEWYVEF